MKTVSWEITKIINVAKELKANGETAASTGEHIAAAFVLNRMELLPENYPDAAEAWERLGSDWQAHVKQIKANYLYLIEGRY